MIDEIDSELGAIIKKHGEVCRAEGSIDINEMHLADNPEEYKKHRKKILEDVTRKGLSEIKDIDIKETDGWRGDIIIYSEIVVFTTDKLLRFLNDIITYARNVK